MDLAQQIVEHVLPQYDGFSDAQVSPLGAGLINQTFGVVTGRGRFVLQKVSPIFSVRTHENIWAVTDRLASVGVPTSELVRTRQGQLCLDLGPSRGVWRVMTQVEGVSFDRVGSPAQVRSAARLLGRFHRALTDLPHTFLDLRVGVHDTPKHLTRLGEALAIHRGHRLFVAVEVLATEILEGAKAMPGLPRLPDQICHGDPKLNNFLFAGSIPPASEDAVCLIDLDTVGPSSLAFELGDAWRSWCNVNGEDIAEASLDLDVFRASLDGYLEGIARSLSALEQEALLHGVEWLSLELASRFAADALRESYFGWDAARFPARGEHNLVRARGQWSLHQVLVAARGLRARSLSAQA